MLNFFLTKHKTEATYGPRGFKYLPFEMAGLDDAKLKILNPLIVHNMNMYKCEIQGEISAILKTIIKVFIEFGLKGFEVERKEWKYFNDSGDVEGPFTYSNLLAWKPCLTNKGFHIYHEATGVFMNYDILMTLDQDIFNTTKQLISEIGSMTLHASKDTQKPIASMESNQNQQSQTNYQIQYEIGSQINQSVDVLSNDAYQNKINTEKIHESYKYHSTSGASIAEEEKLQIQKKNISSLVKVENIGAQSNLIVDLSQRMASIAVDNQASNETDNINVGCGESVKNSSYYKSYNDPVRPNGSGFNQQLQYSNNRNQGIGVNSVEKWNFNNNSQFNKNDLNYSKLEIKKQEPEYSVKQQESYYSKNYTGSDIDLVGHRIPDTPQYQSPAKPPQVVKKSQPFEKADSPSNSQDIFFQNEGSPLSSLVSAKNHMYQYDYNEISSEAEVPESSIAAPTIDHSLPTIDDLQSVSIQLESPHYSATEEYSQNNHGDTSQQNFNYNNGGNRDYGNQSVITEQRRWVNYDHYGSSQYYNNNYNRRNLNYSSNTNFAGYQGRRGRGRGGGRDMNKVPNYPSTSRMIFGNCRSKFESPHPMIFFDINTNSILSELSSMPTVAKCNPLWSRNFERACLILETYASGALLYILQNDMGDLWGDLIVKLPPWTCKDLLHVLIKHWESSFRSKFPSVVRSYHHEITQYIKVSKSNSLSLEMCFRMIAIIRDMFYCIELTQMTNSDMRNLGGGYCSNLPVVTFAQASGDLRRGREEAQALYEESLEILKPLLNNNQAAISYKSREQNGDNQVYNQQVYDEYGQSIYYERYDENKAYNTNYTNQHQNENCYNYDQGPRQDEAAVYNYNQSVSEYQSYQQGSYTPSVSATREQPRVYMQENVRSISASPLQPLEQPGDSAKPKTNKFAHAISVKNNTEDKNLVSNPLRPEPEVMKIKNAISVACLAVDLVWVRKVTEVVKCNKSLSGEHLLGFVRDMVIAIAACAVENRNTIISSPKKLRGLEKINSKIKDIIESLKQVKENLKDSSVDDNHIKNIFNAMKDLITDIHVEAFIYCRKLQKPEDWYIAEFKQKLEGWEKEEVNQLNKIIELFVNRYDTLKKIIIS